jgi:membrane associated rhomboid family serine protease
VNRDLFGQKMGLTLPLCGLHFVFFFLSSADRVKTLAIFGFHPGMALSAPWSFFTYQFLHDGPLSLFFGAMALWILGSALEAEWGTAEFAAFWAIATLGGSLSAWAVGAILVSDPYVVPVSMLFAFAALFPDTQFLVFFVVPVKVKWIAWVVAAFLFFGFVVDFNRGVLTAVVRILGATAGFLWFWVRKEGRVRARRAVQAATGAVKSAGVAAHDASLERRNRDLFPKVEALRRAAAAASAPLAPGAAGGGAPPAGDEAVRRDLEKLVVPGVKICKPVDFKGDRDLVCLRCEGFAECSLRYVGGAPLEITLRPPVPAAPGEPGSPAGPGRR